jgi:hypothetical protein
MAPPCTRALVLASGTLAAALPLQARSQASEVTDLWRDWATVEAEWQRERAVYGHDRERQRALREPEASSPPPPVRSPPRRPGPRFP